MAPIGAVRISGQILLLAWIMDNGQAIRAQQHEAVRVERLGPMRELEDSWFEVSTASAIAREEVVTEGPAPNMQRTWRPKGPYGEVQWWDGARWLDVCRNTDPRRTAGHGVGVVALRRIDAQDRHHHLMSIGGRGLFAFPGRYRLRVIWYRPQGERVFSDWREFEIAPVAGLQPLRDALERDPGLRKAFDCIGVGGDPRSEPYINPDRSLLVAPPHLPEDWAAALRRPPILAVWKDRMGLLPVALQGSVHMSLAGHEYGEIRKLADPAARVAKLEEVQGHINAARTLLMRVPGGCHPYSLGQCDIAQYAIYRDRGMVEEARTVRESMLRGPLAADFARTPWFEEFLRTGIYVEGPRRIQPPRAGR